MAEKALADLKPVVPAVAAFEPAMRETSEAELRALMDRVRQRLVAGDRVEDAVPEVFAAIREAARRTIGQRAPMLPLELMFGRMGTQRRSGRRRSGHQRAERARRPIGARRHVGGAHG